VNLNGAGGPVCLDGLGSLTGSITFTGGVAADQSALTTLAATSTDGTIHLVLRNSDLSFVAVVDLAWVPTVACALGNNFTASASGTMSFKSP
jgi:hypothetical protein